MNRYEALKDKLAKRAKVTMANVMLIQNPILLGSLNEADCILLDKEHGVFGSEELLHMLLYCRNTGIPSIVRVEDSVYHLIAKVIDLGADGIMVPRVESLEQIKTAVDAMHFAPIGRTGCGGWGIRREGEGFEEFQKGRILMPQIESAKGLALIPEMVEKYGEYIDAFIVGPNDYSITMGVPWELDHPIMIKEYEKFFEVCKKYNKSCGIFTPDPESAKRMYDMGANVFWVGDDANYMRDGLKKQLDALKDFKFDN